MKKEKKPLYCCFVDFSKAFDTVWRDGLYLKLYQMNISSKIINIVNSMYSNVSSKIKINGHLSKLINIGKGTRQGCNLSPTLFKIYLNDLPKLLSSNKCDPVLLYDEFVNLLMFADDIVLLSSSSRGLKNFLTILKNYCAKWKLYINVKKTKIMIFNKKSNESFYFGNQKIDHCETYSYLGILIHRSGKFSCGIKLLSTNACNAYFS